MSHVENSERVRKRQPTYRPIKRRDPDVMKGCIKMLFPLNVQCAGSISLYEYKHLRQA
jgi:hypothetical protein